MQPPSGHRQPDYDKRPPQPAKAMYLRSLELKNIRLLADQTFSFSNDDGSPRLWTVLVGDNGLCKTTILQTIALAASGENLARALVDDTDDYRRVTEPNREAEIRTNFNVTLNQSAEKINVGLSAPPGRHVFMGVDRSFVLDEVRAYRTPGYFVAGYGVGRRLSRPGEVKAPKDLTLDRIEGLFDTWHRIVGIEFQPTLSVKFGKNSSDFLSKIQSVFQRVDTHGHQLLPGVENLSTVFGTSAASPEPTLGMFRVQLQGSILPATALSHGYQAMIAWIADLLGHAFLEFGPDITPEEMAGIVLIDEIDLHLPPTWQRRIVPILKRVFPKMQFVVTTHSPLVLTGFEPHEIIRLGLKDGLVVQRPSPFPTGLSTSAEILAGYYDVPRAARPDLVAAEARLLELKGYDSPREEQLKEIAALEEQLAPYLRGGIEDELDDWLDDLPEA